DVPFGPRAGADPLAQPPRGRELRVRREAASGANRRAGEKQRHPRPRPLGVVDRRPAPAGVRRHGAPAPSTAGLPVLARAQHRVRALGPRAGGHDDGDEPRARSLSLRMRFPPVPRARDGANRLAPPARPRWHGAVLRRAGPPEREVAGGRDGVRLPAAEADRRDEARQRLHGPRARRGRAPAPRGPETPNPQPPPPPAPPPALPSH